MKSLGLLAIVVLTVSGSAALAQQEEKLAPLVATGKPEPKNPAEKKICHTEKMTGSLTRVNRICMTAAQWDKLAEDTSRAVIDYTKESERPDRVVITSEKAQGFQ
jgi:hypothetical protein